MKRRLRIESLEGRRLMAFDLNAPPTDIGEGVRAAEVRIQFDPTKVTPQPEDFLPGSAWQGKGAIVTNVDSTEGTVTAFLFSVEPINAAGGELIDIRIPVGPVLPSELVPAFAIESIKVDEGQKEVDPQEHGIDLIASEEIKRQVQARADHLADEPSVPVGSHHPQLQPAAVDQVYGPMVPNDMVDPGSEAAGLNQEPSDASVLTTASDHNEEVSPVETHEPSSWEAFMNAEPSDKGISRSVLLNGVRDDWSDLDRMGYRKA